MISGQQLAREAGITYRQLDYWVRSGVLEPLPRWRCQQGVPRPFDVDEVRVARVLGRMRRFGAGLSTLRAVAPQLRALSDDEWHGLVFVDRDGHLCQGALAGLCWALDLATAAA